MITVDKTRVLCASLLLAATLFLTPPAMAAPNAPTVTGPTVSQSPWCAWTSGGGGTGDWRFGVDDPTMANALQTRNTQCPARGHVYFNGAFGGATVYTNYMDASTIEAWVVAESLDGLRPIFSFVGGGMLFSCKDGRLSLVGPGWEALTEEPVVELNRWTHVAATHDPIYGTVRLFVNGSEVARLQKNGTYLDYTASAQLGCNVGRTAFWHGGISQLRVWERLLTAGELRQSATTGLPGDGDVYAYWPMNEWSGNTAYDMGPNQAHFDLAIQSQTPEWRARTTLPLGLQEGPHTMYVQERDSVGNWSAPGSFTVVIDTTAPVAPQVDCAYSETAGWEWTWAAAGGDGAQIYRYALDDTGALEIAGETGGTAVSYSDPPHIELFGNNGLYTQAAYTFEDITMESWVKPSSIAGRQVLVSTWGPDGSCALALDAGRPQVKDLGGNLLTAGLTVLPVDEWTHLAFTFNRDTGLGRLFVDGAPVAEAVLPGGFTSTWWFACIGCDNITGGYFDFWHGGIREFRVWSTALDQLEMTRYMWTPLPGTTPNLVARYPLDDMAGTAPAGSPQNLNILYTYYDIAWRGIDGGPHTLYVQERDEAGNWSAPGECTLNVDREGPPPPQFSVAYAQSNDMTFTWTWTGSPGGQFWVRCDGGAWIFVGGATSWTPGENLATGFHTLEIYEVDEHGNGSQVVNYAIYLDPSLVPLEIQTGQDLYASFSEPFSMPLQATGGDAPYTWTAVDFAPYTAEVLDEPIWMGGGQPLDMTPGYALVHFPWPIRFFNATVETAYVDDSGTVSTPYGEIEAIGLTISFTEDGHGVFFSAADEYMAFRWKGTCDTTLEPLEIEVLIYRDGRIVRSSSGATANPYHESLEWFEDRVVIPGPFDDEPLPQQTSVQFTRRAGLAALGLTLSSSGVLSGSLQEPGTFAFDIEVADAASYPLHQTRARTFIIHVGMPAPVLQEEPEWTQGAQNSVTWEGPGDSYYVECSADPVFAEVAAAAVWVEGTAFEFDELDDAALYYYRAKSRVDYSTVESDWSNVVSSSQDNSPPTGAITINAGAQFTNDTAISVLISTQDTGSGIKDMTYSLDGADWADWQPYLNLKQFVLPGADGIKPLAFKFRDNVGNVSQEAGGQIALDRQPPQIDLLGDPELNVPLGARYLDAGASAYDAIEGDLTARLEMNTNLDTGALGAYTVSYNVTDSAGNAAAAVTRVLRVVDLYMPMVTDGATVYLSSSAGPVPLILSFNAPPGAQSVVLSESVLSEATTLPAPNGQLTLLLDPETVEMGSHTLELTAVLNDLTEVPVTVNFTLAPPPENSDVDANGIPDNPFSLLGHGDLWLNLAYVEDAQAARITLVKRADAAAAAARVTAELAVSSLFDTVVSVSAPAGVLNPNEAGVLIVSAAPSLEALLGDAAAALPQTPAGYVMPEGGMYALLSFIASSDGIDYREIGPDQFALDPVSLAVDLPAPPPASAALYTFPAQILSDAFGLYAAPAGEAWTTDNVAAMLRNNTGITADLTALSIVAPFQKPDEQPPAACLGSKTTSTRATADLLPLSAVAAVLILRRRRSQNQPPNRIVCQSSPLYRQ